MPFTRVGLRVAALVVHVGKVANAGSRSESRESTKNRDATISQTRGTRILHQEVRMEDHLHMRLAHHMHITQHLLLLLLLVGHLLETVATVARIRRESLARQMEVELSTSTETRQWMALKQEFRLHHAPRSTFLTNQHIQHRCMLVVPALDVAAMVDRRTLRRLQFQHANTPHLLQLPAAESLPRRL